MSNDATQNLVDEARRLSRTRGAMLEPVSTRNLLAALADALEAAQRGGVRVTDDATQKLVDEARRWAGGSTTSPVGASLVQDLADALEAARPRPSRESAHVSIQESWDNYIAQFPGVLFSADDHSLYDAGYRAALEAAQRLPVSPEVREALDELIADVLIAERDEWPRDPGDAPSEVLAGAVTDALLARLSFPTLDTDNMRAEK